MKPISLFAVLWFPLAALAQTPLLSIPDPEGDDVGDGSLVYPRDASFTPGDLDLRRLNVYAEDGGLRFEATFRNAIRSPSGVKAAGLGSEDLSLFARRGFYSFNIDVYIDTDRIPGSGNVVTLPGRHARVAAADAWEKVVVLTPRPELMRRQLHDALEESGTPGQRDAASIDQSVFFATDVRVRGRSVSFFVPRSFLGALNVADWSLTTIVTAAKTTIEAGLTLGKPSGSAIERLALGAQQPEAGRPEYAIGYRGDRAPATAVVDLLAPDARQQRAQLASGDALTGVNRDNKLGAAIVLPAEPPAAAPAANATSQAPEGGGSWFSRALQAMSRAFAPATGALAVQNAPTPIQPGQAQPQAMSASAPTRATVIKAVPPTNGASASRPRDAGFFEEQELRLRALKRLRDGGLITEEEYQQKRREVLEKL